MELDELMDEPVNRSPQDDGAVAQLGERQLCKLDVVGSIPISSTRFFPSRCGKRSLTSAYEG